MLSAQPAAARAPDGLDRPDQIATRAKKAREARRPPPLVAQPDAQPDRLARADPHPVRRSASSPRPRPTFREMMDKFPDERNAQTLLELGQVRIRAHQEDAAIDRPERTSQAGPQRPRRHPDARLRPQPEGQGRRGRRHAPRAPSRTTPANLDLIRPARQLPQQAGKNDEAIASSSRSSTSSPTTTRSSSSPGRTSRPSTPTSATSPRARPSWRSSSPRTPTTPA